MFTGLILFSDKTNIKVSSQLFLSAAILEEHHTAGGFSERKAEANYTFFWVCDVY